LWKFIVNTKKAAAIKLFILISLATISIILQFTSTLLLTDVGSGLILSHNISSTLGFGVSTQRSNPVLNSNYWTSTPATFARFLEYSEPPEVERDRVDTGVSVRGFLPIASQNDRAVLRSYHGPAALFDTRVICSQPDIKFSQVGSIDVIINSTDPPGPAPLTLLTGHFDQTVKMAGLPDVNYTSAFDCSYSPWFSNPSILLCQVLLNGPGQQNGLPNRLNPFGALNATGWVGHTYLLWDMRNISYWLTGWNTLEWEPDKLETTIVAQDGVWQNFVITNEIGETATLQATVCRDSL
jgi:hypothetical protein